MLARQFATFIVLCGDKTQHQPRRWTNPPHAHTPYSTAYF